MPFDQALASLRAKEEKQKDRFAEALEKARREALEREEQAKAKEIQNERAKATASPKA